METRQVVRPLMSLSHVTSSSAMRSPRLTSVASCRHQSTTSRTKKMLKIRPHPDFLTPQSGESHIIYNPPAAASSVYHTPFKFLPKSDPRRQANISQILRPSRYSAPDRAAGASAGLPPLTHKDEAREKKHNVTLEQVKEMRMLREANPSEWTVHKLAKKFECTPYFIMMCCKASAEHKENENQRLAAIKARWGTIRTKAREERKKRKVLLLQSANI
ncbi:mitochondrial ribosomal protein subunit L20-domain-containing protein [Xylaria palmicola]|nr:mitochondrial ribosomal protein subunit L20-domain-containing protein [Xylaria palmicola]